MRSLTKLSQWLQFLLVSAAVFSATSAVQFAAGQSPPQNSAVSSRVYQQLQGKWDVVTVDALGKVGPEIMPQVWTIAGDTIRVQFENDTRAQEYRIKLNPFSSPPSLELACFEGIHAGATAPGVFELFENTLRVRYDWDFGDWKPGQPWDGKVRGDRGLREYGLIRRGRTAATSGEVTLWIAPYRDAWGWNPTDQPVLQYQMLSVPILRPDGEPHILKGGLDAFAGIRLGAAFKRDFAAASKQIADGEGSTATPKVTIHAAVDVPFPATQQLIELARDAGFRNINLQLPPTDRPFQVPLAAIDEAKRHAVAERARRQGGLKFRRPKGLEDLETDAAVARAVDAAMRDLSRRGEWPLDGEIANPQIRLEYLGDAAFDALRKEALDGRNAPICCHLLGHLGTKSVPTLVEILSSKRDPNVREAAARELGQTFHPDSFDPLLAALGDKNEGVRIGAVWGLKGLRDPRAIAALQKVTAETNGHIARDAIQVMNQPFSFGTTYWPPELLELHDLCWAARTLKGEKFGREEKDRLAANLQSGFWGIRSACAHALISLDAVELMPAIIAGQGSDRNYALAKFATPEAIDALVSDLNSPAEMVRENSLSGLASGGGRWAAPLIVAMLDDTSLHHQPLRESSFALQLSSFRNQMTLPESHAAHIQLMQFLSNHGLRGEFHNAARGEFKFELNKEMDRAKKWWQEHGDDFLAGKDVPNPKLSSVMYID